MSSAFLRFFARLRHFLHLRCVRGSLREGGYGSRTHRQKLLPSPPAPPPSPREATVARRTGKNSFRRLQAHAVASDRDSHREGGMDAVMFRLRTMKASHRMAPSVRGLPRSGWRSSYASKNSFRRLQAHAVASDRDSHREGGMDALLLFTRGKAAVTASRVAAGGY